MNEEDKLRAVAAKEVFRDAPALVERVAPGTPPQPGSVDLSKEHALRVIQMAVEGAAADDPDVRRAYAAEVETVTKSSRGVPLEDIVDQAESVIEWLGYAKGGLQYTLRLLKKQGKLDHLLSKPAWCAAYEQFTGDKCESESN